MEQRNGSVRHTDYKESARKKADGIRSLVAATGIGALWGGGAGLIIAAKGTGHVPWQAGVGVPLAIGVLLGAAVGGILLALQRQRSQRPE